MSKDLYIKAVSSADTDIEVNGVAEGSVSVGSTLDIQLTDGVNPVTPINVTQNGNNFEILLPNLPLAETITNMFEGRVIFDSGIFEAKKCLINILKNELI